jgi:acyl-CoA synthetase (AMP-forming)/AMP-acid ligase II
MSAEHSADLRRPTRFSSLPELLEYQADRIPDAPAILAPGRAPVSYGRLYRHVEYTAGVLRAMGLGRHDRVAVVLPSGPELAVALLAVAASAVCAPLNPAYEREELERYFADLRPRALITAARVGPSARRVALSRGIRVFELSTADDAKAGLFTLTGEQRAARSDGSVSPGDVALLQLTSGTTSRPKTVPLTHANVCRAADTWGAALALRQTDRCLNVMPLFHGHGLIATVLASLAAGSSVVCTAGYEAKSFFAWLTTFRPTWYSAVPTIHRAILAQARHHGERAADHRLRFVRSGAAPLPPAVFAELERTFRTPVIEFCGMTETAASPVACNPLPPRQRKAGSIGLPVDLEIAIMDEGEAFLPHGRTGEIVVRGASVMHGYDADPIATRAAFAGDWFKTGDLGFFDDDGYLFLVGRKREIINRGGEKIAPWEVDEVLREHPAVAEAATFAVPHPTLGEDVAAAVVMRPHARATTTDIRQFVTGRVADFKIPRQVLIVSELPKSPTGKMQRVGLAAKLGLASHEAVSPSFVASRTSVEKMLAGIWAEVLQVERVGVHDDFFALGGDSLLVTHVLLHVYEILHLEMDVSAFFAAPTIAETARHLETLIQTSREAQPSSAIERVSRDEGVPASIAQERLWKLQRVLRGAPFFNILYALRLMQPVDTAILEQSVNEIVRRHEILRTTFAVVDGRQLQVIAPQSTVRLGFDDLRALPASKKKTVGRKLIQEEALHSFDLAHGPLFRARLVRLAEQEHILLITMHRIIVDEWSLGVLVDELFTLYGAFSARAASPLPPLSIQYADVAHWQRHWRSHPDIVAQLAYWREQLRDPLPEIELAAARPRRTIDGLRTARRKLALPASLLEDVRRFSRREGGTLFMVLVAALKTLLHRYVRQDDLRVATFVANRNRPRTESLIGPMANTVILRTNLGGDPSLREVMRRVRATTLAAFANQDLPFEELVDALERDRALRRSALAQVMITLQNERRRPVAGSGRTLALQETDLGMPVPLVRATTCDISLIFGEDAHGLRGSCVYKPQLFDALTIDHLLRDFRVVLERMVAEPERPISTICVSLNEKPSDRA